MNNSKIKKILLKNAFPLFGLGSLIWFLIRVIPKPSRAAYPCMRVAAPFASSFIIWLLAMGSAIFSFKKMKHSFNNSSSVLALLFLLTFVFSLILSFSANGINSYAESKIELEVVTPLKPIGEAKGLFPGRVVWVWDSASTNQNCSNSYNGDGIGDMNDDGWFLDKNNNQEVIDEMLSNGLLKLTKTDSLKNAWDSIFRYFNKNKHSMDIGYGEGQNIFIKINSTSSWGYGETWGNITTTNDLVENRYYGTAETSPQIVLSLLRQLVNILGINQENISVGDPMRDLYNNSFNKWHDEFPNIHYVTQHGSMDREKVIKNNIPSIIYSDKGNQLLESSDTLYKVMLDADYLINMPQMKAHALAGITIFPKNHFGSHTRDNSQHLHPGLIAVENGKPIRTDSAMYRVQVDLMGHEKIGGNQILFLLDALWAGSEATDPPTKWDLSPFNGDWTSSIFLSQDMVAIESVAYDFLSAEYDGSYSDNIQKVNYPNMKGTTDYLRQAASPDYWPDGIIYDPENDGIPINSLGVNEHWNNKFDKQYSRNLGTGNGIELIFVDNNLRVLEAPTNIIAEILNVTDVILSWIDNSNNEDGFIIERKDSLIGSIFQILDSVGANQTSYIDTSIKDFSSYFYRIRAFNSELFSEYTDSIFVENIFIVNVDNTIIENRFTLYQNYPNPFNPTTTIKYTIHHHRGQANVASDLPVGQASFSLRNVTLKIFDILGKEVTELVNEKQTTGNYEVEFDGSKLTSGIYFYKLYCGNLISTKKMVVIK